MRRWLWVAVTGCALVVIALIVSALVIIDKETFGGLVGRYFLHTITSGVVVGAIVMLVGALKLPQRKTWRGITLIVWALIALTSPLFGLMFLLPWGVLALMLPVVIAIFITLFRQQRTAGVLAG